MSCFIAVLCFSAPVLVVLFGVGGLAFNADPLVGPPEGPHHSLDNEVPTK